MVSDTLYIVGNGFDLHHGIKTEYKDFCRNKVEKCSYLKNTLYGIYGDMCKENLWWCEFEKHLSYIDYNHLMSIRNGEVLSASILNDFFSNNLAVFFGEWINVVDASISVSEDKKLNSIDNKSLFFSFNYTTLLEKVYNVTPQNVWHIHNSVKDIKKGLLPVVGHDSNERDIFMHRIEYEKENILPRKDLLDSLEQAVANGAKKVHIIIDENHGKFCDLYSNIKYFVVMGFSFNDIDMPYIKEIMSINKDIHNTTWKIYWHIDGECNKMKEQLLKLEMIKENQMLFERW